MQPSAQTLWNLTLLVWQKGWSLILSNQYGQTSFWFFLSWKFNSNLKLGCEQLQVLFVSPSPTQAHNARKKKKNLYAVPVFNTLLAVKTINVVHKQHYTADLRI